MTKTFLETVRDVDYTKPVFPVTAENYPGAPTLGVTPPKYPLEGPQIVADGVHVVELGIDPSKPNNFGNPVLGLINNNRNGPYLYADGTEAPWSRHKSLKYAEEQAHYLMKLQTGTSMVFITEIDGEYAVYFRSYLPCLGTMKPYYFNEKRPSDLMFDWVPGKIERVYTTFMATGTEIPDHSPVYPLRHLIKVHIHVVTGGAPRRYMEFDKSIDSDMAYVAARWGLLYSVAGQTRAERLATYILNSVYGSSKTLAERPFHNPMAYLKYKKDVGFNLRGWIHGTCGEYRPFSEGHGYRREFTDFIFTGDYVFPEKRPNLEEFTAMIQEIIDGEY